MRFSRYAKTPRLSIVEQDNYRQLVILCIVRFLVIGACMLLPLVYLSLDWQRASLGMAPLVAAAVVNLGVLLLGRVLRGWSGRLVVVQVFLDVVLICPLLYFWGGVYSPFTVLLFAPILAASLLMNTRMGLVVASAATVALAVSHTTIEVFPAPLVIRTPNPSVIRILGVSETTLFLVVAGAFFHMVALLTGLLTVRLERDRLLGRQMLNDIGEGVVAVGRGLKVVYENDMASRLLTPDGSPLKHRPARMVLPRDVVRKLLEAVRYPTHVRFETDCGGRPLEVKISSIGDRNQTPRGATIILTDLGERRRAEAAQVLMSRLETLSEVAATIAHEIRNPITAIRGSAQTLAEDDGLDECNRHLMQVIMRESDRVGRIVSEFLQLADLRRPQVKSFRLKDLVDEVFCLLQHDTRGQGKHLCAEMDDQLVCSADAEQLKQVVINLGLNACEAMNDAGTGGRLEVSAHRETETSCDPYGQPRRYVVLDFTNDGPPIDEDAARRIFEPFYSTKAKGSGMGLAIVRKIVESHGGHVEVKNLDDRQGCRFTVRLPAA